MSKASNNIFHKKWILLITAVIAGISMIICCGGLFVVSKFVLQFKELSDSINTPCDEFQYDFLKVSLPPGATILDEQCTEFMTPTYSVIFEMSPEDLATFQQQPPVSNIDEWQTDTLNSFFTEEGMQERKEKLKREGRNWSHCFMASIAMAQFC